MNRLCVWEIKHNVSVDDAIFRKPGSVVSAGGFFAKQNKTRSTATALTIPARPVEVLDPFASTRAAA